MRTPGTTGTALLCALAVTLGCGARPHPEGRTSEMTPRLKEDLARLRRARVYFYHHSVGENVLAGVGRLDAEAGGGPLRLASPAEAAAIEGPVLAHGGGGRNGEPRSKVDAFAAAIRGEPGLRPELAMMKFCYVDFDPSTDVAGVLAYYRSALEALKRDFPGVRFAHVSVPLTRRPTDVKASVRRLLGLQVWEDASNARRAEFNQRLKDAFPSDPIFDLATVEATGPDGGTSAFELDGRRVPTLQPAYTEDGSHLNRAGQEVAGAAAIHFAAEALGAPQARR